MAALISAPTKPMYPGKIAQEHKEKPRAPTVQKLIELDEETKRLARNNDSDTIELLFTMACMQEEGSNEAAEFLLSLYSGRGEAHDDVFWQLGQDSMKLYEIVTKRNANKPAADHWKIPSEILIMAGFEAGSGSQARANIAQEIAQQSPTFSAIVSSGFDQGRIGPELFETDRFVTGTELDVAVNQLRQTELPFRLLSPIGVSEEAVQKKIVEPQLALKITPEAAQSESGFFVPLLFRQHWVLFGVKDHNDNSRQGIVFSSLANYLNNDEKIYLSGLAKACGSDGGVLFIEKNLQEHAPNACGVFLAEALNCVARFPTQVAEKLQEDAEKFSHFSIADQVLFNRNGRASLFSQVLQASRAIENSGLFIAPNRR